MSCNNCNPTCYSEMRTDCVEYTGQSYPDLCIEQGDSLSTVINKTASELSTLKGKVEGLSCCGDTTSATTANATTQNISGIYSSNSSTFSSGTIEIETEVSGDNLYLRYNIEDALNSLSGDVSSLSVKVYGKYRGSTATSQLGSSGSSVGAFNLKAENCPLTIELSGRLNGGTSDQENINYTRNLDCISTSFTDFINVQKIGSSSTFNTQEEINSALSDKINSLESNTKRILSLQVDGSDLSSSIIAMNSKIEGLLEKVSQNETLIASLESRIETLERKV